MDADEFGQHYVNPNGHGEFHSSTHAYHTVGVLAAGGALGTLGNVLVAYFFHSRRRAYPGRHFILMFVGLDLITCLLLIPMIIFIELVQFPIHIFLCKFYQLLVNAEYLGIALVLMVAVLERLFYFSHPMKYPNKMFGIKVICFAMVTVVVGTAIIVFLSYCNVVYYDGTYSNTCHTNIFLFSADGVPQLFRKILLIIYFLPFVFVVVVYCKIYPIIFEEIWLKWRRSNESSNGHCGIELESQESDTKAKRMEQDPVGEENADDMNPKSNIAITHRFCIVTIVFWLVYLPTILIETNVVRYHTVLFYMFLVHSVVKPLMYIGLWDSCDGKKIYDKLNWETE